jgi:diguanylate cyclase (GGDEF)-like protein
MHRNTEFIIAILTAFDARTTALLVVIAFFIQSSAIGAQAFLIREYRGVGTALLGNLSLAIGFLLTILRGSLPDFITIILSNILILLGPSLFYIAVSRFANQKYNVGFIVTLIGIVGIGLIYYRYVVDSIAIRIIAVSLGGVISVSAIAYKLWQARNTSYRFSVGLTLIPFVTYGILLIIRVVATIISPPQKLFSNTPIETATYLILFLISFLWTLGFVLMVSQRLQADLRELATIDSLTRIPNRRAAQTFLEKELSRAQRKHEQFSVLLIDIDNFKQINDQRGHAIGDHVLVKSAEIFQANIRKQDLVGRWGGEEFLVILSGTALEDASCLAERLRNQIEKAAYNNTQSRTTVSIGVASSKGLDTIDQILKNADDALYVAKATKNAVIATNIPKTNLN